MNFPLFWQLRSSQSYCNDNECLDLPGFQGQSQNESNMLFLIVCWAVLAMGLFLMRPRSLRTQNDSKPSDRQVTTIMIYLKHAAIR